MTTEQSDLIQLRHAFHKKPEIGFQEHETKARITGFLQELGMDVREGVGVIGILKAGTGNRAIALRADMDALPIHEKSAHAYPSETAGCMHACGHDGHITMLLGAAQSLAKNPEFDGTVVFIFQPAEEHGLGAKAMLEEGLLERFPFEEVYAIHNLPGTSVGHVLTRQGVICSSESLFEITIDGQGGHASMPQAGRDAITVGAEIVQSLQTIVSRKIAPGSGAVVSVTEFLSDGQRNVLAGRVTLKGDVRARSAEDRTQIEAAMRRIVQGLGAAHQVDVSMDFRTEFIETENASAPTEAVARIARRIGLPTNDDCEPMSFSEDFAHFTAQVPGCFLLMGNGIDGPCGQPLHANNYDFNDDLIPAGVSFWAALVRDRLAKPG